MTDLPGTSTTSDDGPGIGAGILRRVSVLLDLGTGTTTESQGGGYGGSLTRAPYPSAPLPAGVPAGLRTGRLTFHSPDGMHWAPESLHAAIGHPVQHPRRPALFAGAAVTPGGPRCWIADVPARSVTFLEPVPAVLPGGETPLAWAGSSLAVAVEPPAPEARQVFEVTPGRRIRLAPLDPPPDRRPSAFVFTDPEGGPARPSGLEARPYQRVRAAAEGRIAACFPGPGGGETTVAACGPGVEGERLIRTGPGPLHDFRWLAEHLVTLTERPDGFEISTHTVPGPTTPLHRHAGRYVQSCHLDDLFVLASHGDGSHSVVIVTPGSPQPAVRTVLLPTEGPAGLRIAAVRPSSPDGDPGFATVDLDGNVTVWSASQRGTIARRISAFTLPSGRDLVTVADWNPRVLKTVTRPKEPDTRPPAHPGGLPPTHGTIPEAPADFSLHLPERHAPEAALVWLSQPAPPLPGGDGAPACAADPSWLTLAGFAVLHVRLTPAWWPEVPDEEIRPRLVRQIRTAVQGGGLGPVPLTVGGTSFGATLALTALAESGLFRAAIVQSGAYSRHLTPLGFQDETRTLWEAPRVYRDFDAIVNAPRIRRPVLIIHGEADRNPATPVAQATLLFQALIANGTRARLVILPGEGHVLHSRTGIATSLAEKAAWLEATR